jgi:hypothetical protein
VNLRTRESVRSMPQGWVWRVVERRCVIIPRDTIVRPGKIIVDGRGGWVLVW